jgi:hypothetical protein
MLFQEFPKIPRLSKGVCVTEKLDGTNACVVIDEQGNIGAQSRSKLITPESDNYGFAGWVQCNRDELAKLGPGYHFGEWWGLGIQRRYNLPEKRFSLFNVGRWADVHGTNERFGYKTNQQFAPACCYVVPILSMKRVDLALAEAEAELRERGSVAAPGFMKPEGLILYMVGTYSKFLLENDDTPKGLVK